jgi:hypothetical protein
VLPESGGQRTKPGSTEVGKGLFPGNAFPFLSEVIIVDQGPDASLPDLHEADQGPGIKGQEKIPLSAAVKQAQLRIKDHFPDVEPLLGVHLSLFQTRDERGQQPDHSGPLLGTADHHQLRLKAG